VVHICGCAQDWTPDQFVETTITDLKKKIGNDKVIMALSGGVDSTVAATLIIKPSAKISSVFLLTRIASQRRVQPGAHIV